MTPSGCAGRRGDRVWEPGHRVAGAWRRLPHPPASAGERGAGTRAPRGGGAAAATTPPAGWPRGSSPSPRLSRLTLARTGLRLSSEPPPFSSKVPAASQRPAHCPRVLIPLSQEPRAANCVQASLRCKPTVSPRAPAPTARWFPPGLSGDMTSALSRRVALRYDEGRERVLSSVTWFLFEQYSSSPVLPL